MINDFQSTVLRIISPYPILMLAFPNDVHFFMVMLVIVSGLVAFLFSSIAFYHITSIYKVVTHVIGIIKK